SGIFGSCIAGFVPLGCDMRAVGALPERGVAMMMPGRVFGFLCVRRLLVAGVRRCAGGKCRQRRQGDHARQRPASQRPERLVHSVVPPANQPARTMRSHDPYGCSYSEAITPSIRNCRVWATAPEKRESAMEPECYSPILMAISCPQLPLVWNADQPHLVIVR